MTTPSPNTRRPVFNRKPPSKRRSTGISDARAETAKLLIARLLQVDEAGARSARAARLTISGMPFMASCGFHRPIPRVGEAAKMPFPIHPHMLRHACGFKLANDGHDTRALQHYLGHKNIQYTVRYTEMAPDRFRNFWR